MTLTGDMMDSIDVKETTRDTVTIGWTDETNNNKAFNHTTGDTVPKRDFFGIPDTDLQDIKRDFKRDVSDLTENLNPGSSVLLESLRELIDDDQG